MAIRPWNGNIWFSPCYVINRLLEATQMGTSIFDRQLKKHKEAWICSVAVILYSHVYPAEWWIQIPKYDPPDALAMVFVPTADNKGQDMAITQFEVFEINSFSSETIEGDIKRKLSNKDYSKMVIVGYVRREGLFDCTGPLSSNTDLVFKNCTPGPVKAQTAPATF